MADGNTITISDGTNTVTYTHAAGQTVQDVLDAVNNDPNLKVDARLTADGRLQLEASGVNNVVIGGSASVGELSALGLVAGTTTSTLNTTRQALAQQFDSLREQIDTIARDAGFNGQNLLGGDVVTVTFNETGSARLAVSGSLLSAAVLGVNSAVSTGGNFQSDTDINGFLTSLDAAAATLRSTASSYGADLAVVGARETFIKDMSSLLTAGADNLVLADPNEEGVTLLALQTRRDLAVTSLSLASRGQSDALRLFGL
jgi:flagellin-like hook-associated protein FlgL